MPRRNLSSMNADAARLKYFNSYVEYETLVRRLAKYFGIRSQVNGKYISLNSVLVKLTLKINNAKKLRLMQHKSVRNWLAHKPKNLYLSKKYHLLCEDIPNTLTKIKEMISSKMDK